MPYGLEKWLAGRWIAGPSMDDALAVAKRINKSGISVIINYLGEGFGRKLDVDEAVETYLKLMAKMAEGRINGDISVKPTQIGLSISQTMMKSNYAKIMEHARKNGIFVWLDMEEPKDVGRIIDAYLESSKHPQGGICIQAYLNRSMEDARRITRAGGIIRLVKGAYSYREGGGMLENRAEIDENYRRIRDYLLGNAPHFTIATHDRDIILESLLLNRQHRKRITYAMLNGIDNRYLRSLAAAGEATALYLPFGTRWVGYSYRRLKEVGHARLIVDSLFKSQKL